MKKLTRGNILSFLFLITIILVIAYFTGENGEDSDAASLKIADGIERFMSRYFTVRHHDFFWTGTLNEIIRKMGHFTEFFLLGIAACSFFLSVFPKKWLTALVSFALCGLVAMADEFRQTFVSGRSPRWFDVKLDMIGALVGIGIFMGFYFLLKEYKRMKNRIKQLEQELKEDYHGEHQGESTH